MKVLKNFAYTSGYQIFSIIVPIITTPYISRKLGPAGMGINAFSLSLVQVFVLFAYLGTQKYGNNVISKNRNDNIAVLHNFKNVYTSQILTTTATLMLYFFYIQMFITEYRQLYLVQSLYLISVYFDVSWFFQGKEDFRTTVLRGMGSKLVGMLLIFILIKGPKDTTLYGLILGASSLLGNIVMWLYLWKEIDWKMFFKIRIEVSVFTKQLKNIVRYFIPVAFLQITTLMYQLILGWHASNTEVAYYANANKIITIPLYIVTSFITVMFPRISFEKGRRKGKKVVNLFRWSIRLTLLLAIPLTFGMIAISPNLTNWFFGPKFVEVLPVMIVLSLRIIPATLNEAFGYLYLMIEGKTTLYSRALSIGGGLSLVLNFLVTLKGGAKATAWVSVISEIVILMVILYFSRDRIYILFDGLIFRSFFYSVLMVMSILVMDKVIADGPLLTIFQVVVALLIYGLLLLCFEKKYIKNLVNVFKA